MSYRIQFCQADVEDKALTLVLFLYMNERIIEKRGLNMPGKLRKTGQVATHH